jgi:hypothetical protein
MAAFNDNKQGSVEPASQPPQRYLVKYQQSDANCGDASCEFEETLTVSQAFLEGMIVASVNIFDGNAEWKLKISPNGIPKNPFEDDQFYGKHKANDSPEHSDEIPGNSNKYVFMANNPHVNYTHGFCYRYKEADGKEGSLDFLRGYRHAISKFGYSDQEIIKSVKCENKDVDLKEIFPDWGREFDRNTDEDFIPDGFRPISEGTFENNLTITQLNNLESADAPK